MNLLSRCVKRVSSLWGRLRGAAQPAKNAQVHAARWERDYLLNAVPELPLFDEYLEMGTSFCCCFSWSLPWPQTSITHTQHKGG